MLGSSILACFLLLSACAARTGTVTARPPAPSAASRPAGPGVASAPARPGPGQARTRQARTRQARAGTVAARDTFGLCEQRLRRESHGVATLAIAGASYTAGVGPGVASLSWAAVLARTLRWNAVIYGVPGAGYVSKGYSALGPVARMLSAERLRPLDPSLVIVQAGHDDGGVPRAIERRQVTRVIEQIRAQAPAAAIALLTVFTRPGPAQRRAYYRIDQAIVTAARGADPAVIIMDPLTGRWKFAHLKGSGLHPTAAGDAQIARRVAAILRSHGIVAAPAGKTAPLTCQVSVGLGASNGNQQPAARDV